MIDEARADIAESVAVTVKNCMEKAFKDVLPGVRFVVEPEIRDSWGDDSVPGFRSFLLIFSGWYGIGFRSQPCW